MLTAVLSTLVLASALLNIRAEHRSDRRQVYIFKPLTTALIIFVALQAKHANAPSYPPLIVAGLICSLAGDVFLMLPRDRFVAGLVSFLFAHILYTAAFTLDGWHVRAWTAAVFAVYGFRMLSILWPRVGGLKVPVAVYMTVILLMALQASGRWLEVGGWAGASAGAGAVLFVVSDSALAWERFVEEFRGAQTVVLGTYFAAQWLIALST
ncbi:MAG TPA: lysoplasmalogenase [Pyrinomonadaceae bacterium]|nr:lysoplasmalogenase [Pyrinomonadaceae bacterium]